jgi:hypothetical protein
LEGTMAIRLPLFRPELDPVDRIEIPTPCSVPWDSMYGDDRTRHCGSCRKNVYNVAELTRTQAMQLIASREEVCVRIYRRPDGTVVTSDCWSRLRAARRRGTWPFLAMLVIVGWAQLAAMIVGIVGLRRLVLHATMGSRPAAPVSAETPPPAPLPRVPPESFTDPPIIMGALPSRDFDKVLDDSNADNSRKDGNRRHGKAKPAGDKLIRELAGRVRLR